MPAGQPSHSWTGRRSIRLQRRGRRDALSRGGLVQLEGPRPGFPVPGGQQARAVGRAQAIFEAEEGLTQVVHACKTAAERTTPWQVRKKVLPPASAELSFMTAGEK